AVLDAGLAERDWLSGPHFGIADMPMGVYAHTYFALGLERPALTHLAAWYARLRERPAFAEIAAIPLT
ncbi:glutathione S-transferase, partial [Klebsiella pneumoniae]